MKQAVFSALPQLLASSLPRLAGSLMALAILIVAARQGWCAPQPADIVTELKERQAKIRSVSAKFTQEKKVKLLEKPIRSTGRFFYKQPGSVRWEYGGDAPLHVITNGKELWLYYPDMKEAEKISGVLPFASLMHFDMATLTADYDITARREKGVFKVKLVPKARGFLKEIEMDIPENTAFPKSMKLIDSNNEPTVILFTDVRLNKELGDDVFRFTPPPGVTVRERALR